MTTCFDLDVTSLAPINGGQIVNEASSLVETELSRIVTQYREAERLKAYARACLTEVASVASIICDMPRHFDLNTAAGEQLTFIGERMGFPRCHCVCAQRKVFGWSDCPPDPRYIIGGFCDDVTFIDCVNAGVDDVCLVDDEVYRGFLKARRYDMLGLYDLDSMQSALGLVWGADAWVVTSSGGAVTVAPGRDLTAEEDRQIQIVARVLPIPPGITLNIHRGALPIFGFGEGWGGFCDGSVLLCAETIDPYTCS